MMILTQMILGARTDDREGLIQILVVIIFFAISIISNIAKNRSKSNAGKQPARRSAPASSHDHEGPDNRSLGQQSFGDEIPQQPGKKRGPGGPAEVTLRPSTVRPSLRASARHSTSGGFAEALGGKSKLDRFLEAKLEPRKRKNVEKDVTGPAEPIGDMAGLEDFGKLETGMASQNEPEAVITSLELNADNIADAIVFAEILAKPLALRDA